MRLSLDGHSLGGSTRVFLDNVQLDLPGRAGNPQWWNWRSLFQLFRGNTPIDYILATYPYQQVDPWGQSHLFASAGTDYWAAQLNGFRDSRGKIEPSWAVVAVDDTSARAAVVVNGGLYVWDGLSLATVDLSGADTWETGDIHFSRGVLGYRKGGRLVTWGRIAPVQVPGQGVRFDGEFVLTWQEGRGLVMHTWGSTRGLVIATGDNYNPDIRDLGNGLVRVVAGINQADEGEHRYDVDWMASTVNGRMVEKVDLATLPLRLPTFGPFNHPILVAPFKDTTGMSGAPAEIIVNGGRQRVNRPCFAAEDSLKGPFYQRPDGIYSEAEDPTKVLALAEQYRMRLLLCHDVAADWAFPSLPDWTFLSLRPWDLPMVELYRFQPETLAQASNRWHLQLVRLLGSWSYDVGLVAPFYTMSKVDGTELWPEQEVLDGLAYLTDLVNLSPRIKLVAPFSYDRANGISGHPVFKAAFEALLKAANPTDAPIVFKPIGGAVPVPVPVPTPPPPIPVPEPIPAPITHEDDTMAIPTLGTRGGFREWGSLQPLASVTVVAAQDDGFMALQRLNGKFVHFDPITGRVNPRDEDNPSGEARVKFQTGNVFVSRSGDVDNGPMQPFEFYAR